MLVLSISVVKLNKRSGYSLILVPMVLTVLFCFVALIVDFGRVLILKYELQTVVDSAAIAGASMITIEYPFDGQKYDFSKTITTLDVEKASKEADIYFDKNIEQFNLASRGVKILEKKGEAVNGNSYQYFVKAEIPISFMAKALGTSRMQDISLVSQAEPAR